MAGRPKKDHDQKVRDWIDWYERNRRKNEEQFDNRLARYQARTEEQVEADRQRRRERYRQLAEQRIADGWHGPYRRKRTDVIMYRTLLISMLLQRDGNRCGLCGSEIEPGQESPDHIIQKQHGGPDTAENIRIVHRRCNVRRPRGPQPQLRKQRGDEKDTVLN